METQQPSPSLLTGGNNLAGAEALARRRLAPLRPEVFLRLIGFVCLLLVGLQGWHEWADREDRLYSAQIGTANIAASLARSIDQTLEMGDVLLAWTIRKLEAEGLSRAALQRLDQQFAAALSAAPHLSGYAVHLADGELLASTPDRLVDNTQSDRGLPSPAELSEGGPHLLRQNAEGGRWSLALSRSFRDPEQRLAGTVLVHIDVDSFVQGFQGLEMGEKGAIGLFRTDGRLLARFPQVQDTAALNPAWDERFRTLISGIKAGSFGALLGVDGVMRLGSFQRAERYPVTVLAMVARDEVLAEWAEDARVEFGAVLLLAGLVVAIGFSLFNQMRQRQAAEQALEESEAGFRMLAEHAGDIVSRLGPDGAISYISPAVQRLLGRPPKELLGRRLEELIHPEDRLAVKAALKRLETDEDQVNVTCCFRDGAAAHIWTETLLRAIRDTTNGKPRALVAVSRDVTERHSIALRLEEQARTDSLTGLANRRRFDDAIQAEWSRSARDCIPISLILLDVDHFKRFNDQYGHQAGDECLRAVAAAIRNAIRRPGDIAARYGGEEFAVILPATDRDAGARVAEQVRAAIEALSLPHAENAGVGVVTASLGLATMLPVACAESPGPMNLIAAADAVLYAAKSGGRNRVCME